MMSEYICCADGDLKPCPVCGGKNTILVNTRGDDWDDSIDCPDCGMRFTGFETAEELIEAFNTRSERTCHDLEPSFYTFGCDKCGVLVEGGDEIGVLVSPEVSENRLFNYCPNCGAKVVE